MSMVEELDKLIADYRNMPLDMRRQLRKDITKVGKPVLKQIKSNAAWSTRIPRATRMAVKYGSKTSGVTIRTSGRRAPHAAPYENEGEEGIFRHPRWGHKGPGDWIPQQARPFFYRAGFEAYPQIEAALREVVDRVAHDNGWK